MVKYILVPATASESDTPVFETALAVARLFAAHIEFLHVRVDVRDAIVAMTWGDAGSGAAFNEMADNMERDALSQEQKARQAMLAFCTARTITLASTPPGDGVSAEWRAEVGNLPDWLAAHGRAADLVVAGRPDDDAVPGVLEAGLLASGRPLLIAPPHAPAPLDGTVVIAWKNAPEAARAVTASLPFLAVAKHVVIVSVQEDDTASEASYERLQHALRWHNPNTSFQLVRTEGAAPAEALLGAAKAMGAGLLVMGGYGHSRLREVVFGGFTRAVLKAADLPVLMAH